MNNSKKEDKIDLDLEGLKEFSHDIIKMLWEAENILMESIHKNRMIADEKDISSLDFLFRVFHNIKGTTSMLGLTLVPEIFHSCESLLQVLREKKIPLNLDSGTILLEGLEYFKTTLNDCFKDQRESQELPQEIIESLVKVKNNFSQKEVVFQKYQKTDEKPFSLMPSLSPLDILLQGLLRLVKQISSSTNKKVKMEIIGGETLVDRKAIGILRDPLIHLIRNAIDHGIESQNERKNLKKSDIATLKLALSSQDDVLLVELSDDGKGIKSEKILEKAISQNLLTIQDASLLSPQELNALIFLPGLSTADSITTLSGRGVGLDSVKYALESVGGKVEFSTQVGKGTTFKLTLPHTFAE